LAAVEAGELSRVRELLAAGVAISPDPGPFLVPEIAAATAQADEPLLRTLQAAAAGVREAAVVTGAPCSVPVSLGCCDGGWGGTETAVHAAVQEG
ncbi:hypothetical protein O6217_23970, partial [Salmonella enterica subsp. enterica]